MLKITSEIIRSHKALLCKHDYVVVQHLKNDTAEFVELMQKVGCNILQVLGVNYSVDEAALERLRQLRLQVDVPDSYSEIPARLLSLVEKIENPAIILDVGGYGVAVAERPAAAKKVSFIVEDTNNGLWQYQSIHPQIPIIEVASIENKSVENAFVGRRIVDGVGQFFKDNDLTLSHAGVVVVGFGGIGRSVCSALSLKGINAAVVEVDERKLAIAEALGHRVGKSIGDFIDAKVIIGCTGVASVNFDHLAGLPGKPFLISGSSKEVEFENVLVQGRFSQSQFKNASKEEITGSVLVNNGEPINLHYGSLDEETSDFMFANIAYAIIEGTSLNAPGISKLSDDSQRDICRLWWNCYRS
jgi:S-adenosylhomocysteine hydrolase